MTSAVAETDASNRSESTPPTIFADPQNLGTIYLTPFSTAKPHFLSSPCSHGACASLLARILALGGRPEPGLLSRLGLSAAWGFPSLQRSWLNLSGSVACVALHTYRRCRSLYCAREEWIES